MHQTQHDINKTVTGIEHDVPYDSRNHRKHDVGQEKDRPEKSGKESFFVQNIRQQQRKNKEQGNYGDDKKDGVKKFPQYNFVLKEIQIIGNAGKFRFFQVIPPG
jgi:hypothetical protein